MEGRARLVPQRPKTQCPARMERVKHGAGAQSHPVAYPIRECDHGFKQAPGVIAGQITQQRVLANPVQRASKVDGRTGGGTECGRISLSKGSTLAGEGRGIQGIPLHGTSRQEGRVGRV